MQRKNYVYIMSRHQSAGQNYNLKTPKKSSENRQISTIW